MKVLFVSSGNSKNFDVTPFIKSQGESLSKLNGVEVDYLPIIGKGIFGYYRNRKIIREYIQSNNIDIIHAHYVLSGWLVVISRCDRPIVISLMGSDAYGVYKGKKASFLSRYLTVLTWLIQPFVDAIISKSPNISSYVYQSNKSYIIPNGIQLDKVKRNQSSDSSDLGLDSYKINILFLGDPKNPRKNFELVQNAVDKLNDPDVELIAPYPVDHDTVLKYLNKVDVFVMASYMEGSPNVVKEAQACNCPMVVTDVGDAAWIVEGLDGCYVSSFNVLDYSEKLQKAISFSQEKGRTKGLERIIELGLDSKSIAEKIHEVYKLVLK